MNKRWENVTRVIQAYEDSGRKISNADLSKSTHVDARLVSEIICILRFGTKDEIDDLKTGARSTRKLVTLLRERNSPVPRSGRPIKMDYNKSVVETVSQHLNGKLISGEELAKKVGFNIVGVRFIRKLLLLQRRNDLTADDYAKIDAALKSIDQDRRFAHARRIVGDTVDRLWVPSKSGQELAEVTHQRSRVEYKNRKRLDNTLFAIRESCTNNEEMLLPPLSESERQEALEILMESMSSLCEMFIKIKTGEKNG